MIKRDSPTSVDCPIRYVFSFDTGEDCRQTLDFSVVAFLKSRVVGVAWYSVLVSPYEYGVVVGGFLVNISGGKEKARHIFINAAGCCEIVPRCSVVGAAGRQSEVRKGRGAWSVRRLGCAFFSCQQFNGFGEALAEKGRHDGAVRPAADRPGDKGADPLRPQRGGGQGAGTGRRGKRLSGKALGGFMMIVFQPPQCYRSNSRSAPCRG